MNIFLNDYKTFNGRYIIYESKWKGKEYNSENILLFAGEFLNGERKKGKEYFHHEIKYEGEYVNRKKNGFGKEYWGNGQLYYEGNYLKGKKHGFGKEYHFNGALHYEGEFSNNCLKNGKEYDYFTGKLKSEGEYLNGIRNGKGKEYYDNGKLKYDGEYLNDKKMEKEKNIIFIMVSIYL